METNLLREILTQAVQRKELVAIYADADDLGAFAVGIIQSVGDMDFNFQVVSPEGEPDGYGARRIDEVVKIQQGSRYLRSVKFLAENRERLLSRVAATPAFPQSGECTVAELDTAMEHGEVVSLQLGPKADPGAEVSGYVENVAEGFVQVRTLTNEGEDDGICTVRIDDIFRLSRSSRFQQVLDLLNRNTATIYG